MTYIQLAPLDPERRTKNYSARRRQSFGGMHCLLVGLVLLGATAHGNVKRPSDAEENGFVAPPPAERVVAFASRADADNDGIYDDVDLHPTVYDAPVTATGSDYTLTILGSGRVVNLVVPAAVSDSLATGTYTGFDQAPALTKRILEQFRDAFDTIILTSDQIDLPAGAAYYGISSTVKNDTLGIGSPTFDLGATYGASGKLQQVLHLTSKSGLIRGPSLHEILHRWANDLKSVPTGAHWEFSSVGGQLGGWAPATLQSLGNGQYSATNGRLGSTGFGTFANGGNSLPYAELELYLMGLIPITEVPDVQIAQNAEFTADGKFTATALTTVTPAQIIAIDGVRAPAYATAQKRFRVLYVVVTKKPLSSGSFADYDADVQKFGLVGDDGSELYNFWEATGGRAVIDMGDVQQDLKSAPARKPVPVVTTLSSTDIAVSQATVGGWVNPNGFATTATFEYGPTFAYGRSVGVGLSPVSGTTEQQVTATLVGLRSGTTYHYRITATNSQGPAVGYDATFMTTVNVTTVAGGAGLAGANDGAGSAARFNAPYDVAVDRDRNLYVADFNNHTIRRITPAGVVTTLAGTPGVSGSVDGSGSVARFTAPHGVAVDGLSNVYVADSGNCTIRRITPAGVVTTFAGKPGVAGSADGPGGNARFSFPTGVEVDADGNVYVAECGNHTIRKITPAGVVATLAGSPGISGSTDGAGNTALFWFPVALAVDGTGNIYVAESGNNHIRKITPAGVVSVLAGQTGWGGGVGDGVGSSASFNFPLGVAADYVGNVFIADHFSDTIRKITPAAIVTTLAGASVVTPQGGSADGIGRAARFNRPRGLAVDSSGNVFVADTGNHTIRRVALGADANIFQEPASSAADAGRSVTLEVRALNATAYQWRKDGSNVSGSTGSTFTMPNLQPSNAGLYTATVVDASGGTTSAAAIVGVLTTSKVIGAGEELTPADIHHPNGNIFDQVLMTGAAETITADYNPDPAQNQVTRTSFVDLNNDIVQVEFSGPGTLSLVLDSYTPAARPVNYNQAIDYVKGHAGIVITGADEHTNVSVFSVGKITAVNQALFKPDVAYDGIADIAFIAIASTNGKFGGLRASNANCFATRGLTGIYAPGVQFLGPVFIGDINAFESASPVFVVGSAADTRITGGDLLQPNSQPVVVDGLTQLKFADGVTSHNSPLPAQANKAVLLQNGTDVTARIVVTP